MDHKSNWQDASTKEANCVFWHDDDDDDYDCDYDDDDNINETRPQVLSTSTLKCRFTCALEWYTTRIEQLRPKIINYVRGILY